MPSSRAAHPSAAAIQAAELAAAWRPMHLIPLDEFLGPHEVLLPADFSAAQKESLWRAASRIGGMDAAAGEPIRHGRDSAYEFRKIPGDCVTTDMIVVERASGEVCGGISGGVRWVVPRHRGRGIGSELVLAAYSEPGCAYLMPNAYSYAGWRSRVSAHRKALERAAAEA